MAEDLTRLAGLVHQRARAIETTFASLRARDFPSYHFETLAAFPHRAAFQIRKAVRELLRQAENSGTASSASTGRMLRRYGQALEFVHQSLGFVMNAEVLSIPAPFVLFLEELGSDYLEPRFVLQGAPQFNYSFSSVAPILNDPLVQANITKARLPDGFAVFRFPAALRDDGLQHSVLAHELGHYVDTSEHLYREAWLGATPRIRDRVERFILTQMGTIRRGVDPQHVTSYFAVLTSWVIETVCDMFAAAVLGPAYLFSAVEFVRFHPDLSKGSDTHPPSAIRLWAIRDELRHFGWQPAAMAGSEPMLNKPGAWTQRKVRSLAPSLRPSRVLERCLWELLPSIRKTVRRRVGAHRFDRKQYDTWSIPVRDQLMHHIPPGEWRNENGRSEPVPARAIVNGAWFFHLDGYPQWPSIRGDQLDAAFEKRQLLNRLTMKALEISYVLKHWVPREGSSR